MVIALKSYLRALDYLYARTTGETRLGLERTKKLLEALGNPQDSLKFFHIAGTNGKGSVSAIMDRLLRRMGFRVGKYTSPHLVDFRERILIDGAMIDESVVTTFVNRRLPIVEQIGASFFEATTVMALDAFARAEVDVVVLETGLGGRLDATNVVLPCVATVTNVGMDHVEYLGGTIAEIAKEKAGIFKRGIPAVIGDPSVENQAILAEHARRNGSHRIHLVPSEYRARTVSATKSGSEFDFEYESATVRIKIGLRGKHQVANACTGIASLMAAGASFSPGRQLLSSALTDLELAGRCQISGDVLFDVAHNPDGMRVLVEALLDHFGSEPYRILLCIMSDKDWRSMIEILAPVSEQLVLTIAPSAPATRHWNLDEVAAFAADKRISCVIEPDFDVALRTITGQAGKKLITGSFHTVGDAMYRLQVSPLTP